MKKDTPKVKGKTVSKNPSEGKATKSSAPKWQKSPQPLVDLFSRLQDGLPPEAEKRKMFGYPSSFVNGQMFAGLHQANMVLRLDEEQRAEFLLQPGAKIFEPMPGRVMREYVVVPESLKAQEEALFKWTVKSFTYARSLEPKAKKGRR